MFKVEQLASMRSFGYTSKNNKTTVKARTMPDKAIKLQVPAFMMSSSYSLCSRARSSTIQWIGDLFQAVFRPFRAHGRLITDDISFRYADRLLRNGLIVARHFVADP